MVGFRWWMKCVSRAGTMMDNVVLRLYVLCELLFINGFEAKAIHGHVSMTYN